MSLTATLTLLLPLLRTAVRAGCSGVGVVMASFSIDGQRAARGAPLAMPSSCIAPDTAATASFISAGPIAPMQPTRNVSTSVSLPG
jgi:hypothetical protein